MLKLFILDGGQKYYLTTVLNSEEACSFAMEYVLDFVDGEIYSIQPTVVRSNWFEIGLAVCNGDYTTYTFKIERADDMIYMIEGNSKAYATDVEGIKRLVIKGNEGEAEVFVDLAAKVAILRCPGRPGADLDYTIYNIIEVPSV